MLYGGVLIPRSLKVDPKTFSHNEFTSLEECPPFERLAWICGPPFERYFREGK